MAPEHLQVDPLMKFYHDIVATMREAGYTLDEDLFVANYDWRVDVGPDDGTFDGHLEGLTADSITDSTYEYGVDYLGYWLDFASDEWAQSHNGERPESVDIISHSTGGLVARAYIQSEAYGGHVSGPGGYDLPVINDFIMVGVPNQGAAKAWNMLANDWDADDGFRIVISKIVDEAYDRLQATGFISGPDYDIVWDDGDIVDDNDPTDNLLVDNEIEFIEAFAPTARTLLATYAFIDRDPSFDQSQHDHMQALQQHQANMPSSPGPDATEEELEEYQHALQTWQAECDRLQAALADDDPDPENDYVTVNDLEDERNSIVLDLNDGLGLYFQLEDLDGPNHSFTGTDMVERAPNAFIDALAGDAVVVYTAHARDFEGGFKDTANYVVERVGDPGGLGGAGENKVLPFSEFLSNDPAPGETWYQEVLVRNGGDGTVPTISSVGQFQFDPDAVLEQVTPPQAIDGVDTLDHTGLMGFTKVQRDLVTRLVGVTPDDEDISVDLKHSGLQGFLTAVDFGIIDGEELLDLLHEVDITDIVPQLNKVFGPLAQLSAALQSLFNQDIPLVGEPLRELMENVVPVEGLLEALSSPSPTLGDLFEALPQFDDHVDALLTLVVTFFDRNPWLYEIIDGETPDIGQLVIPFHVSGEIGSEDLPEAAKAFDIGLGVLGLDLDGTVDVSLSFQFDFDVVLDLEAFSGGDLVNSVYIDTDNPDMQGNDVPELIVALEVTTPGFGVGIGGHFGLLEVEVRDFSDSSDVSATNPTGTTGIFGTFTVDLFQADGRLTAGDLIPNFGWLSIIDARLEAVADINLLMTIDFGDSDFFPSFSLEFDFDWDFDSAELTGNPSALLGALPSLAFNNIELHLGTFFSKFARPIIEHIQHTFDFLSPLTDVLDWRIPVLSDFEPLEDIFDPDGGNVQLSDVFRTLGLDVLAFLVDIDDIHIPTDADNIRIDFGSWRFSPADDLRTLGSLQGAHALQGTRLTDLAGQIGGLGGLAGDFFDLVDSIGFAFPLFSNPKNLLDVLLGRTATLFEWRTNINEDVGIHKDIELFDIPGLPNPDIEFDGDLEFNLNLAFGFDTSGLASGDLARGFFIRDVHGGSDKPELALSGEIEADVDLDFSAGIRVNLNVSGGVDASIAFDLHDPNEDGLVRGDEIRQMGLDCLIEAEGRLRAGVSVSLWVGIRVDPPGPGSYTKKLFSDSVSFSTRTLSFDIECDEDDFQPPVLATLTGGGLLRLNVGEDAIHRGGDYTDGDIAENYLITHLGGDAEGESVRVTAFGFTQDFQNVTGIFASDAGGGDDVFELESVLVKTSLHGGEGDDVLIGGMGRDTLHGDAGNDQISGGDGDDTIHGDGAGETGNDYLSGGEGADAIHGGRGRDVIRGETGNDILRGGTDDDGAGDEIDDLIFGGMGDDEIYGDAGHDSLQGDQGNDFVLGGSDDDIISWQLGDGVDTIDGLDGIDQLTVTGSNGGDAFEVSRQGLSVVVDLNDDQVAALGIEVVNLELGQTEEMPGTRNPDASADSVLLRGTVGVDVLGVHTETDIVHVDGLGTHVAILDSSRALDTLTVDTGGGDDFITAAASDEFDTDGVRQDLIALRLVGGTGDDRLIGSRFVDFLDSGTGDDHVTGAEGVDVFVDAGGHDTIDETRNANFTLSDASLRIGAETEALNGQFEEAVLTGGASANSFTVQSWTGRAWLDGKGAGDTYTIHFTGAGDGQTTITDNGASGTDTVTVNGTDEADAFTLSANTVAMGDATETVHYFDVEALIVNGRGGDDDFQIDDNGASTTVNAGEGDDYFVIGAPIDEHGLSTDAASPGVSFAATLNGDGGNDDFQVNRNVAALFLRGGTADDSFEINLSLDAAGQHVVNGPVDIDGGPDHDTLTVNGTPADDTFTITAAGITGTGLNVTYMNIEELALNGRGGRDTFNVRSTNAALPTTLDGGADDDRFNVGSEAPASGGTVDHVAGALLIIGGDGVDTLNVDDTGSTGDEVGTLTDHTLSGLGLGADGIDYSSLEFASINLGAGHDLLTILATHAGDTRVRTGRGADTVVVETTDGPTGLDGEDDGDTVVGPDVDNTWHVTEDNGGDVSGDYPFEFATFENLVGGTQDDRFVFSDATRVGGSIDGDDGAANSGIDILDYSAYTSGVTVNLTTGTASNAPGGVTQIEHLIGGSGGDSLTGDGLDNILIGNDGDDHLDGMGGADLLLGDRGSIEDGSHAVHFDQLDAVGGDDEMHGGDGTDLMWGQRGNDDMQGGAGDDEMVGGLGSDVMDGGDGDDMMLGDAGVIGGNVLLLDVGLQSGYIDLQLGGAGLSNEQRADVLDDLLDSDFVLLGAEGIALVDLVDSGSDIMSGGAGDDHVYGQRGDDRLSGNGGADFVAGGRGADMADGGDGDDEIVGDDAFVDAAAASIANVAHGLALLQDDGPARTVMPMMQVMPGRETDAATQLLPRLFGAGSADDPYVSLVADIAHHVHLLAGNDVISGGAGDDTLVGDDLTVHARAAELGVAEMAAAQNLTRALLDVTDDYADLVRDLFGLLESYEHPYRASPVIDAQLSFGNDSLHGDGGSDTLVGDNANFVTAQLRVPAGRAGELAQFVTGTLEAADEAAQAVRDLMHLEHDLRNVLVASAGGFEVVRHVDEIRTGNDRLFGGEGNDLLIGDQWVMKTPVVTLTAGGWGAAGGDWHDADWLDSEPWHAAWLEQHRHHPLEQRDLIYIGNDFMDGGAGADLMWGDSLALSQAQLGTAADLSAAEQELALAPAGTALAAMTNVMEESAYWFNGHHHRYQDQDWHWHQHHAQDRISADVMEGAEDSDLLFGQAGADALYGEAGADWLVGGQDQDTLDGGAGTDKEWAGDTNSSQLRDQVKSRLINWDGAFDRFGLWASPFRSGTAYSKSGQQLNGFDYLSIQGP